MPLGQYGGLVEAGASIQLYAAEGAKGKSEVDGGEQVVLRSTAIDMAGPVGDEGDCVDVCAHVGAFVGHVVGAHHFAVVGEEDDEGVAGGAALLKATQQVADLGVDVGVEAVVVGDVLLPLVFGHVGSPTDAGKLALAGGFV